MTENPVSSDNEIFAPVRQIIQTIATLQKGKQSDWLSWREVARHQEGSEELADVLSSYALLEETKKYFHQASDGRKVSLAEAGRQLLHTTDASTLAEPQKAARAVKAYARHLQPLTAKIVNIKAIGNAQQRIVHVVQIELDDALIPNDAPVTIVSQKQKTKVKGRIVSQDVEEGYLYVALESRVGADALPGYMNIDRAFLLHKLGEALNKLENVPIRAMPFMQKEHGVLLPIADNNSEKVATMLSSMAPPWTRFLWGPPGAGKTYGLAHLVSHLLNRNPDERILLVAPSNTAVDVALLKVIDLLTNTGQEHLVSSRHVLRYGYPRHLDILSRPELLGTEAEKELSQEIRKKANNLREVENRNGSEEDKAILRAQLLDLQEELKKLVFDHANQCQIVATTTTLSYLPSSPISQQAWSTVIVDEVTMVSPAVCLYLSSLVEKRFLLAGDPRQLGPVFESRHKHDSTVNDWMGRDLFDFAHLSTGEGMNRQIQTHDNRLVRITSQRRSNQDIWQKIKCLYPDVNNLADEAQLAFLRQLEPTAGHGVAILDIGQISPKATCEVYQKSWQNPTTAQYAVQLAQQWIRQVPNVSVAIITPYRAQYRLIKKAIKEADLQRVIQIGTIHQFQGSEADLIIFDIVDGPGRNSLGRLLVGDTGLRLINVAISRAKGKFVILANKSWSRQVMKREQNPLLWDLLLSPPSITNTISKHPHETLVVSNTSSHPSQTLEMNSITTLELPSNLTKTWLHQLEVGAICEIPSKQHKRILNATLTQIGLKSNYDNEKHVTVWENNSMQFLVDHNRSVFCRLK